MLEGFYVLDLVLLVPVLRSIGPIAGVPLRVLLVAACFHLYRRVGRGVSDSAHLGAGEFVLQFRPVETR